MTVMQIISLYFVIGVACGLCFDVLMDATESGPNTMFERFMWITLWPLFVLIFILANRK